MNYLRECSTTEDLRAGQGLGVETFPGLQSVVVSIDDGYLALAQLTCMQLKLYACNQCQPESA